MMFEQKERCINCKHLETVDICYFCGINHEEIEHPYRMGGYDECECYEEEKTDPKPEFEYPKKCNYSKCPKCGGTHLTWNKSIEDPFIKCVDCGYLLRKGKLKFNEWSSDDSNQKIIEMREQDVTFENVQQLISEMEKQGFEITSFGHIYKFKKKNELTQ